MTEGNFGEAPDELKESTETQPPAAQHAEAGVPAATQPAENAGGAATAPTIESDAAPTEGTSSPTEAAPPQPETPKQIAERNAKNRMFNIMKEDFGLSDDEMTKLHEQYDNESFEALTDFYNSLTPDWVYDPVANSFDNPALKPPESDAEAPQAEDETTAAPAEDTDVEDEENLPPPPDSAEQVEVVGEVAPEVELNEDVSKVIDTVYRQKAWQEYYKRITPDLIRDKFGDKYPPGTKYEDLDDNDKAVIEEDFKEFLAKEFMPRVAQGEFGPQKENFIKSMKAAGIEFVVKGYETSDFSTFMRTLLLHDAYRSGSEASNFTYNENEDRGKAVDVVDLKNICGWSNEKGSTDKNKEKWMMLCALLYRQLQETDKIKIEEWTSPEALDQGKIREHMQELFELCVESGKSKVNEALVKAFDSENGNSTFSKPSFAEGYATQNLIVHFQMMANHSDYTENFFK